MPRECVLAIDQGTTNTKGLLVDRTGSPVFCVTQSLPLVTTTEGFTEQDPELIWESVVRAASKAAEYASSGGYSVEAIAISNQRETALAWEAASGKSAAPAISWQCVRGAGICNRLAPHAAALRAKTGLPLAPLVSAAKWAWLLENNAPVKELAGKKLLRIGTVDSWLIHKLTDGAVHATDLTNASRTGLLNLSSLQWDGEILRLYGIPLEALPSLESSSHLFGRCEAIPELRHVPVMSAVGDSHAAMFGHARYAPGTIKATYGTGSSLMTLTPALTEDTPKLARTIAWSIGGKTQFALEGNIAMTGSAVQWLGEFLRLKDPTNDLVAMAAAVGHADGVYFVPAMTGLGAPHWDEAARAAVFGLGRQHKLEHWARAAIESIAFQIADVFFAMETASSLRFPELRTDGGATRNASLMQFQADLLGRPVLRSLNEELSAIGAAWLSGLALGWWNSPSELETSETVADRFEPAFDGQKRERLYQGWQKAVAHTLSGSAGQA
jgi:glycerol kinase